MKNRERKKKEGKKNFVFSMVLLTFFVTVTGGAEAELDGGVKIWTIWGCDVALGRGREKKLLLGCRDGFIE